MTVHADEITIGTGSRTGSISPFNNGQRYSWNEMIYPSSSFSSACTINKISFWNSTEEDPFAGFMGGDPYATTTCNILRIYMGVKDANTFSSTTDWTPESELTLVYDHNNIVIGGEVHDWQDFILDVPYNYTAEGNLVIVVAKKAQMPDGGMVTYQYDQVTNTCLYRQHNSQTAYMNHPGTSSGTRSNNRARLKLNVTPYELTCHRPLAAEALGSTHTTATIGWTPYEGTDNFDVYIGDAAPAGTATPTVANVGGTSYTFTGLTAARQYVMAVRSNCGGGDVTKWRSVATLTSPDFIGEGTEGSPYLLYSLADFESLSNLMNSGWNTTGKYFRLMADIDDFNHITKGTFYGKFDGDGHTVTLNQTGTPTSKNISVFEFLGAGAYIHDLNVEGTLVNNGGDMAISAGVACKVYLYNTDTEGILVENCVSKVNISAIQGYSTVAAAGIIGNTTGSLNNNYHLTIKNCVFDGEINTEHNYSAGIIGQTMYGAVIENCVNKGNITGSQYVGGITGMLQTSTINNCVNKGNVTGTNYQVGGLVGLSYNNATITNSYNLGNVEGLYSVGGIVGESTQNGNIRSYIYNVYTTGSVTYTSSLYGPDKTGAIIGMNSTKGGSYIDGAYYLEGTGTPFGPASDMSYATNYSGFTRGTDTNCTLTTTTFETNDLRTALNNKRAGNTSWNEWFDDIYGNNRYYPTFVVGNAPGLEITPSVLAMGPRPIGAWMHPEVISFTNTSETPLQINSIEFPGNTFFCLDENIEFPIFIGPLATAEININTNKNASISTGEVSATMVAVWGSQRTTSVATITATAYNPVSPDVYEKPEVVNTFPYVATTDNSTLNSNYYLPGENPDGPDAVYKLTFSNDVNFNAELTYGSNAKIALYAEDFGGEPGPGTENNWRGPVVHHGQPVTPVSNWFYYDDGNFLNSVGGVDADMYFGIMIPAENLAGYDGCYLSKIKLFDYASLICTYDIMISQGGDDKPETLIGTQSFLQEGSGNWKEIALESPVELDVTKNLWVTFHVEASAYSFPAPACTYTGDPNGNWISQDGITWYHANDYSMDFTWMVRAFVTNQLEDRSESYPISWGGDDAITNLTVPAGTYYLVTSSTSTESTVSINPTIIPTPSTVTYISPSDGQSDMPSPISLEWELNQFTTEYQLLCGTNYPPTEIVQDWTSTLSDKFVLRNLQSHSTYFWQVNQKNSSGIFEGPIWGFTTTLNAPEHLIADTKKAYEGEEVNFVWNELTDRSFRGYNIYKDGVKLNSAVITDNEYTVDNLEYNMEGYVFNVTAVYDAGESVYSNDVVVKVSGEGVISGNVFEQDGVTVIAGADITVKGYDEHKIHHVYTTTADANGSYSMNIKAGTYYIGATSEGYDLCYYYNGDDPYVIVNFENETDGININLRETYNPVAQVTVEEISSEMLHVTWNRNRIFSTVDGAESTNDDTRAFQSYNVYRSNCYNEDDKELVAEGITETELMDGGWADLEAGSYKMGVSCVYEGNRGINLRGVNAFGSCLAGLDLPEGFIQFDIENSSSARVLSNIRLYGGDYYDGIIYAYDQNLNWVKIVPETGEVIYELYKDFYVNELEFDYTTKTMYGISHNELYTINLENGDRTLVTTLSQELIVLGIDVDGNMYGITAYDGDLYAIDRETWECTFIGATGLENGYIQSGTIDKNTGTFYWAWLDGPAFMSIYDINLETAEATLVSDNMGEITALSIPYDDMPKPLEPGNESAIVWSNCIDKDMIVNVSVNVTTNDASSPEGTTVTFENISEPQLALTFEITLDETGHYEWDNFRKGTYEYSIRKAGFASCASSDVIEINENQDFECLLEETFMPVENLYVSHTGWAMWTNPLETKGTNSVTSYKVFVNGIFDGNSDTPYHQLDVTGFVEDQTYTTSVIAVYSTGLSEAVDYEWTYVSCDKYETASSYNASVANGNVTLTWTAPGKDVEDSERFGEWYYYDNGVFANSIGTSGTPFYWGVMFPAGTYNGENVTKVMVYDYMAMTGDIMIYEGGNNAPETLIATQPITLTGVDAFIEIDVEATINPEKNLWIVIYNASGASHPAAACENTGDANGRWVSIDGTEWMDLASAGLDYTFMLRAFVEGGGTIHADVLGTIIYRDGELIVNQPIAQSTYTDVNPEIGTHEYTIRMVYSHNPIYEGHYYAMGCEQTKEVVVTPTNVNENEELSVSVYPNPTNGNVFVEAIGMKRIVVVNTLGQKVYEQDIDTDNVTIDMSHFQAGMYVMNIITDNNIIVKNISLVK